MSALDRDAYWQAFRDLAADTPLGLPPFGDTNSTGLYQYFKEPRYGFELVARINEREQVVAAQLINRRLSADVEKQRVLEALSGPCNAYVGKLESDEGKGLQQLRLDEELPVASFNEEQWTRQHVWLLTRLISLATAFFPALDELEKS